MARATADHAGKCWQVERGAGVESTEGAETS
jgi:hypothetical protein